MENNELTMLVGTYTTGKSKGIYLYRFNEETGDSKALSFAEAANPSFLSVSMDGKYVYAVEEGNEDSAVNCFSFNKEKGTLAFINRQLTNGESPCHINTDGKNIITANYGGGSLSVLPINNDGSLQAVSSLIKFEGKGLHRKRQLSPHPHYSIFTPDGKYLLLTDLGTDKIYKFNINDDTNITGSERMLTAGTPESFHVAVESGPRHIIFSQNGNYAYLINEISGKVTVFEYKEGMLKEVQSITSDTVSAQGSADIHISPDGKFLYSSNRLKNDGIAIFRINAADGTLERTGYQRTGIHPRNFIITPNGKFLLVACRDIDSIQVYERDIDTGLLTNIDKDIMVYSPVCIKFAQ